MKMTKELVELYIEATCGLVYPFPKLTGYRSWIIDSSLGSAQIGLKPHELADLVERERLYYLEKAEKMKKFLELYDSLKSESETPDKNL